MASCVRPNCAGCSCFGLLICEGFGGTTIIGIRVSNPLARTAFAPDRNPWHLLLTGGPGYEAKSGRQASIILTLGRVLLPSSPHIYTARALPSNPSTIKWSKGVVKHTRVIVTHYRGPDALQVIEEERPEPKRGEVDGQRRSVAQLDAPSPATRLRRSDNGIPPAETLG